MKRGHGYGKPLGNKHGMDLTGYYKVFFDEAKYRIVYTYNSKNEVEIIEIVAVGKRNNFEVYRNAYNRIRATRR